MWEAKITCHRKAQHDIKKTAMILLQHSVQPNQWTDH